jgi:hypothetical protein
MQLYAASSGFQISLFRNVNKANMNRHTHHCSPGDDSVSVRGCIINSTHGTSINQCRLRNLWGSIFLPNGHSRCVPEKRRRGVSKNIIESVNKLHDFRSQKNKQRCPGEWTQLRTRTAAELSTLCCWFGAARGGGGVGGKSSRGLEARSLVTRRCILAIDVSLFKLVLKQRKGSSDTGRDASLETDHVV